MAEVLLRLFGDGDSLGELTALLHRAYAELAAAGMNFTAATQDAEVTGRRIEGSECWLAFDGGTLAGTVTLTLRPVESLPPSYGTGSAAFLHQLAVEPGFRGRGLGRRLLDHAEARAAALGFGTIALDTAETASHLLRLYAARGYREVGRHRWEGKTYESVVMAKALPTAGGRST